MVVQLTSRAGWRVSGVWPETVCLGVTSAWTSAVLRTSLLVFRAVFIRPRLCCCPPTFVVSARRSRTFADFLQRPPPSFAIRRATPVSARHSMQSYKVFKYGLHSQEDPIRSAISFPRDVSQALPSLVLLGWSSAFDGTSIKSQCRNGW